MSHTLITNANNTSKLTVLVEVFKFKQWMPAYKRTILPGGNLRVEVNKETRYIIQEYNDD